MIELDCCSFHFLYIFLSENARQHSEIYYIYNRRMYISWLRHYDIISRQFLPHCCVEYIDYANVLTRIYDFFAKKYIIHIKFLLTNVLKILAVFFFHWKTLPSILHAKSIMKEFKKMSIILQPFQCAEKN